MAITISDEFKAGTAKGILANAKEIEYDPSETGTSAVTTVTAAINSLKKGMVENGSAFDITKYNNNTTYSGLTQAISGNNVPVNERSGGMSVKFVNSTTNKYEQWRYVGTVITGTTFTTLSNWMMGSGGDGVFDISGYSNPATPVKYANLQAALGTDGANVPSNLRTGGMTVKFINSSTNKYEEWRYMINSVTNSDFTTLTNWQGIDDKPMKDSQNLVKSGSVYDAYINQVYLTGGDTSAPEPVGFIASADTVWNKGEQIIPASAQTQVRENLGFGDGNIDAKPTSGSTNVVTSGGIFQELQTIEANTQSMISSAITEMVELLDNAAVRYDQPQSLTSVEQSQALSNIGISGIDDVPTDGSNNLVKSGGVKEELVLGSVYDVSAHNSGTTFSSLSALLSDENLNTLIPSSVRKGGMSIKFVQSSDNNYVQYMYKVTDTATVATFTDVANWEKVNLEEEVNQLDAEINGASTFNHAVVASGGSMAFNPITLSQNGDSLEISVKFSADLTANQAFAFTRYGENIAVSLKAANIGIKNSSHQWVTGYNAGSGQKSFGEGIVIYDGTSIKLAYENSKLNLYVGGVLFDSSDVQPEVKIDTLCGVHGESNYWIGEIYKFEYTHNGVTKNFIEFDGFTKNSGVTLVYDQEGGMDARITDNANNIESLDGRVTNLESEILQVQDLKSSLNFANGYYNPTTGKFTPQTSGSRHISTTNYIAGGFKLIPKDSNWRVYRLVGYDENFTTVFVSVNDAYEYGDTVQANIDGCKYYRLTMELSSGSAYPSSDCISSMLPIDSVVEQMEEDVNSLNKSTRKELKGTLIMAQGYYHQGNGSWNEQAEGKTISCSNYINGGITIIPLDNTWMVYSVVGYSSDKRIISVLSGANLGRGEAVKVSGAYYYRFTMYHEGSNVTPLDECVVSVISETAIEGVSRINYDIANNLPADCQQLDFNFDLSLISPNYDTTTFPADVAAVYALWESLRTAHADYITKSSAADDYEETPSYLPAPIYLYKFLPSKNRIDKSRHIKVLLYAGEHPNEKPSITTPYEVMRAITEDWSTSKDLELLRSMIDIYVIPCLSPWGYNNNSRINSRGVNLNRNAATINWQSGEIGANYGGTSAASEYETQVLQYYINTIQPDITIDVHAGGTNTYGVICTVDAFINDLKYNVQPDADLVTTITKTGSNRFIIDDSVNFPQDLNVNLADANIQIESVMKEVTAVDSYHGESGNYALEHGVRLPVLIELCGDCSWVNGSYSASNHRWDANMAKGNSRYLMNVLMRLVKYMSEKL